MLCQVLVLKKKNMSFFWSFICSTYSFCHLCKAVVKGWPSEMSFQSHVEYHLACYKMWREEMKGKYLCICLEGRLSVKERAHGGFHLSGQDGWKLHSLFCPCLGWCSLTLGCILLIIAIIKASLRKRALDPASQKEQCETTWTTWTKPYMQLYWTRFWSLEFLVENFVFLWLSSILWGSIKIIIKKCWDNWEGNQWFPHKWAS